MVDPEHSNCTLLCVGDYVRDILISEKERPGPTNPTGSKKQFEEMYSLYPSYFSKYFCSGALQLGFLITKLVGGGIEQQTVVIEHPTRYTSLSLVGSYKEGGNPSSPQQYVRLKRFIGYAKNEDIFNIDLAIDPAEKILCYDHTFEANSGIVYCPEYIAIYDAGNSFRQDEQAIEFLNKKVNHTNVKYIFLRLNSSLNKPDVTRLWDGFIAEHKNKAIVVTNMADLRFSGANISSGLSWERTIQDFLWQISTNDDYQYLKNCRQLIVRIGQVGAAIITPMPGNDSTKFMTDVLFTPNEMEGEFEEQYPGDILSKATLFTAIIASKVIQEKLNINYRNRKKTIQICKEALYQVRKTHTNGYGEELKEFHETLKLIESEFPKVTEFGNIRITNADREKIIRKGKDWTIISIAKNNVNFGQLAYDFVNKGKFNERDDTGKFPRYRTGNLTAVDRSEIEGYQNIRKLFTEYLRDDSIRNPLSIAVFGAPGSGKTFGIKEMVKEIRDREIHFLEYNLSQFTEIQELVNAFHCIRDYVLEGKTPIVFFDEFDCTYKKDKYGWLKFFLVPMQEGKFLDRDKVHPIGKSIFIFAGGVHKTFDEFLELKEEVNAHRLESEESSSMGRSSETNLRNAKIPDFISRIKGHINIQDLNPPDRKTDASGTNEIYKLRRAILLRSLLSKKAPNLFYNEYLRIDKNIRRAFIKVNRYNNSARSMQTVIEMSNLSGQRGYDPVCLPSEEQLIHQLDAKDFRNLMLRDLHYSEAKPKILRKVKEKKLLKGPNPDYAKLVEDIPYIFKSINYSISKKDSDSDVIEIELNRNGLSDETISEKVKNARVKYIANHLETKKKRDLLKAWLKEIQDILKEDDLFLYNL